MPEGRGDRLGLLSTDPSTGTQLLAYCWVDRERRYFISICSSLAEGPLCLRWRWRQVNSTPNADPVYMELMVPQPAACYLYYGACGKIDQHNKLRQTSLTHAGDKGTDKILEQASGSNVVGDVRC
jgi:hypothetical protein